MFFYAYSWGCHASSSCVGLRCFLMTDSATGIRDGCQTFIWPSSKVMLTGPLIPWRMQCCCSSVSSSVVVAIVFDISCMIFDGLIDWLWFVIQALVACLSQICRCIAPAYIHGLIQRLSCCIGRIVVRSRCCVCSAGYVVLFLRQIVSSSVVILE